MSARPANQPTSLPSTAAGRAPTWDTPAHRSVIGTPLGLGEPPARRPLAVIGGVTFGLLCIVGMVLAVVLP